MENTLELVRSGSSHASDAGQASDRARLDVDTVCEPGNGRIPPSCVLITILGLGTAYLGLFGPNLVEDAFITFRVATNLAAGHGYVYNIGERVESTTNLLWAVLLAVAHIAGWPIPAVAAYGGAVAAALAAFFAFLTLRRLCTTAIAGIVTLLAMSTPSIWLLCAGGRETGLYALCISLTVFFLVRGNYLSAGWATAAAFLTRPEGVLMLPALLLTEAFVRRAPREMLRTSLLALVPWFVIVCAATIGRWWYFGALLPNSVIAKSIPISSGTLSMGGAYLLHAVLHYPAFAAAILLAPLLARQRPWMAGLLMILLLQVPIVLRNGGDWMPYSRLMAQYFPLFIILGGVCADALLRRTGWATTFAFSLLLICAAMTPLLGERPAMRRTPSWSLGYPAWAYEALARRLGPAARADDLWAPEAIGMFGYELPRQRIHDFLGLADAHVARSGNSYFPPFGKADFAYSLNLRPTALIFHSGDYSPRQIEAAIPGGLERDYERVDLPDLADLRVYVRHDAVSRFLPSLRPNP